MRISRLQRLSVRILRACVPNWTDLQPTEIVPASRASTDLATNSSHSYISILPLQFCGLIFFHNIDKFGFRGLIFCLLADLDGFNQQLADPAFEHRNSFTTFAPAGWENCIPLQPTDLVAYENFKDALRKINPRERRISLRAC